MAQGVSTGWRQINTACSEGPAVEKGLYEAMSEKLYKASPFYESVELPIDE